MRLAGELDRAERVATAHLAHRVRMATRSGTDTVSAEELSRVHDLGSKLFFKAGIGPGYSSATADDYPAVIVRRLEGSAEGCRWLLARWAEILNLLDREAAWRDPEIVRFIGLLGKRGIEAHFDPELNSLFHAFDALGHRVGHKFWNERRDHLPLGYVGGFEFVPYRQIAPPPSDKNAALILICSVIERHVGRLEELLAEHEQIEAAEADERYDRAALDCSPAFERHRRYQSARHRELMRTLEAFRKLRIADFGIGNGEAEKADGKCRMADDGGQMADDGCEVRSGGCGDGESGETTPQAPRDEMSQEDWDYVYCPSRPGSGRTMIAGVSGGCEDGEPERSKPTQGECPAPQNVQNEANQESTQSSLPLEVESSVLEPQGRKRSQMEGANAPRLTPTVASESGGSGKRPVVPGGSGEGEPETVVSPGRPLLVAR